MKVLLLASASLLLVAGAASAQQAPATPPAASSSAAVTDAELSAVATIGAEGKRLQDEAAPGIAAAATPDDKRKAQYALDDKMEALFKGNNLTFERYNAIASQAQTDKALAAKIAAAPKNPMPAASASTSSSPTSATVPDASTSAAKPEAMPASPAPTDAAKPEASAADPAKPTKPGESKPAAPVETK